MTIYNKSIFIYDVKIKTGVQFRHSPILTSGEYFMVFTDWRPSVGNPNDILTPISPFGSWYHICKDLFQESSSGNIYSKPDYMREKLSACNLIDQNFALRRIKEAFDNGTPKSGVIDKKVKNKAGVDILTGHFDGIGDLLFADNCRHPGVIGHSYDSGLIHGIGAYPWAPLKFKDKFINAF